MTLRGKLKKSYAIILKQLTQKTPNPWLQDNFYVIDKFYFALLKDKKAFKCGDMYKFLFAYCQRNDYVADEKSLVDFLSAQNRNFSYLELISLKSLLAINAINGIADMIISEQESMLPNAIKLLIYLSEPKLESVLPNLWAPEKTLNKFEWEYARFDKVTKNQYREKIYNFAKKHRIEEAEALKHLIFQAKKKNCPLGTLLFAPQSKFAVLWWTFILAVFLSIWTISCFTIGNYKWILIIPFVTASVSVADRLISYFAPARNPLRLQLDSVPKDAKTLVTVATLFSGNDADNAVFDSLARFRYMNPDKNVFFCVLADFPDSSEQYHIDDSKIINSAQRKIDELNRLHGDRFCIYFRERVLNKSENKFGGWERKRGAVCELISHIVHGDKTEYYGGDFIRDIKYMLTLDADTNLSVGSVRDLVSIALHPANKPIIKKGRVISGYGVIQPTIKTELVSAYKTGFSRLVSGAGGADVYATASFNRSQTLFGSGNFCGKGLIDVLAFDTLVNGKFPEGIVLSHDCVEGSVLRTMCASDIVFTDSTPKNSVSFFRRQHRWMRGDFQNLWFINDNLLSAFSKWRLIVTVLRHSAPIFSLTAILAYGFIKGQSGLAMFLLAHVDLFLPVAFSFGESLFFGTPFAVKRYFSKAYSAFSQSFVRIMFELSSLARKGLLALNAYFLAALRLFTRQNTLQWTTAAQTEKLSSSLGKYVIDGIGSVVVGFALLAFGKPPFIRFCGLLYFVYPLVSVVMARPLEGGTLAKPKLSQHEKRILTEHVKDMVGFYKDNVNEKTNFLPPDNIQYSPVTNIALRTSPTNIGFYLISLLAARDFDIIDSKELFSRLDNSISTIEKLDKYKGNLYNWYNIENLSVLGENFVSSVDSGNLIVMLIALKEGLKEYSKEEIRLEEIIFRCKAIINQTDLSVLYDNQRDLFKIGVKPNSSGEGIGCYDLLMSEVRLLAYYAVSSSKVPKKHWQSLGRTLTTKNGYMGMMSWSGTAFEYLMPQLFLPLYRDSFLYESIAFSLMVQKNENPVWGISESGYYAFDSEMNYQYKANGVQTLALRRIASDEKVISPYSSYLALCAMGNAVFKNLKMLESLGLYGKYGLYEALDYNDGHGGLAVKSYMAHHVGMSIIAVANAVKDNVFVKRFMADKQMSCGKELLQEKIPVDAHVFENNRYHIQKKISKINLVPQTEKIDLNNPSAALLSRGDFSAVVCGNGHVGIKSGDKVLCNTLFDKFSLRFSPCVLFSRGDKVFGCAPLYGKGNYSFEKGNGFASQIAYGDDFSGRVRYSISPKCNCLLINTKAEALKKYNVTFAFEPVMDTEKKFRSHVSFSKLFIESEFDNQKRILYFHRRSGSDGKHIFSLAVAPLEKDMSFSFLVSKEKYKANSISSLLDFANWETDGKTGECIDPICLVRNENAEGGKGTFLITCGETKNQCERNIRLARKDKGDCELTPYNEMLEKLLPAILYGGNTNVCKQFSKCSINDLWSKSISGDYPLAVVRLDKIAVTRTESLIKAFLILTNAGFRCELIFIIKDKDKYNRPIENSIRNVCANCRVNQYIGKKGGIFFLRETEISEEFLSVLKNSACIFIDFGFCERKNAKAIKLPIIHDVNTEVLPSAIPKNAINSFCGYFLPENFVVDKSKPAYAPYSFVLTGHRFSAVITQNSLGYTFFDNAREGRLCSFFGDPKTLDNGERIFAEINGEKYDLCALSSKVSYEKGKAVYYGEILGNPYNLIVAVHPTYPIKLIYVKFKNTVQTSFSVQPVMGDSVAPIKSTEILEFCHKENCGIMFRNVFGMTFPEGIGFAGVVKGKAFPEECTLFATGDETLFFLGAAKSENAIKDIVEKINVDFFNNTLNESQDFADSFIPKIKFTTQNPLNDMLMNFFLPYQVAACRFYGRGSFYQSGGAYGFRDQLQDSLALIYSNPKAVRTHIIRCCAHQYEEGDVMHWWHTKNYKGVNRGIRSKCSDDLLYLPIVLADYIQKTEDVSVLDITVNYLSSVPLGEKGERYEQPSKSSIKESVYHHCLRALDKADNRGVRGLILMGSCDWNDAFSLVGEKGKGESVFSTLLYILAMKSFVPICKEKGDLDKAEEFEKKIELLKNTIEEKCFFGDRYARAFCDDGTILGIEECEECKIDILSQAFAAMAGLDKHRTQIALKTAFSKLYDKENKIFKLFSPPFDKGKTQVGYIRGYVPGIRENGGQYTHGAIWGALGCIFAGMPDEALKIMECANPAIRCENKNLAEKYKNEPYVISADIYSGKFAGRGGWSWYTGAAAWFYRVMLEYVYGIKLGANQKILSVNPIAPFNAQIKHGNADLSISASKEHKEFKLDGKIISLPFQIPDGEHVLTVPL